MGEEKIGEFIMTDHKVVMTTQQIIDLLTTFQEVCKDKRIGKKVLIRFEIEVKD